jgi:PKD repeat protein
LVKVYNPDGSFNFSFDGSGNGESEILSPMSMAINYEAGEIVVLDRPITCMDDGYGGCIWVNGARIKFLDMNGVLQDSFSQFGNEVGQMYRPQHLTVDSESRIYVTDTQHNVVLVYERNGTYLGAVYDQVNPMRTPLGITMGNSHRLFIASLTFRKVEVYGILPYTDMEISPLFLSFEGQMGGADPPLQNVQINNNGPDTLNWTADTNNSWITLPNTSGSIAPSAFFDLDIGVDLNGLNAGTYLGSVSISAESGVTEQVYVELTVLSIPLIANTGGPYAGIEGQSIMLDGSNSSGVIVKYEWDIDNTLPYEYDSPSPTQSHVYGQSGIYTIKLKVTDNIGQTDEALTSADISDAVPSADFIGSQTGGAAPLTVNFTNNSTGYDQPLTYAWDFDNDGTTDSSDETPTHIYNEAGTYTVKLVVTDSDASTDTLIRTDYITVTSSAYNLDVSITGNGTVMSSPSGIDCGIDCTEQYNEGASITLTAAPTDGGSSFTGWTGGGCSGTGNCIIVMNGDTAVTATFNACSNSPVRVGSVYYSSLQVAYDAADNGTTIESQAFSFTGDINIDRDISVTIEGGYNCEYTGNIGKTTLIGNMTTSQGTLTTENFVIE